MEKDPEAAADHEGEAEEDGEQPGVGKGVRVLEEEPNGSQGTEPAEEAERADELAALGWFEFFSALGQIVEGDVVTHAGIRVIVPLLEGDAGLFGGELQGADVGHDGPTVAQGDIAAVTTHEALAVGDHIEDRSVRAEGGDVGGIKIARLLEVEGGEDAILGGHTLAIAGSTMADGAMDVVALLAALDELRIEDGRIAGDF